jgi:polyphenol oxidase
VSPDVAVPVLAAELGPGVGAWFTARDPRAPVLPVGAAGNLSHRRPHRPADLAATRREVAERIGHPVEQWHLLRQVHGAEVAVVDASTPVGAELRDVDAAVTDLVDRPLVVQVADCVPVLLAAPTSASTAVGVVHAGWRGVMAGVVTAAVKALRDRGSSRDVRAVVGPAIGGCCYEVPDSMRREVAERWPAAGSTTSWGTPSLDLTEAVLDELRATGVDARRWGHTCTRCDPRWFSHRRDPDCGRFVGIVVGTGQ